MPEAASDHVWAWSRAVEMYRDGADLKALWPVLEQAGDEVEMLREMAVQRAASRETWKTIGEILGVSRQAAAKRYGWVRA
jgi:hypothetical protein